ncbi:phage replisome organizer N-terminal domain-containing protein [Blautia sp. HCP3S3_G3]|uniref:phage replisome organizer N-terminal domain-containing protein n=1 Tax=Blautia sp. HCP3S3_G3 TaxID=3438913 RepID=UPI003F8BE98A
MAANKRYYWLKMKKSFWDEPSVLFLRNLPSGDTLVIIYLKLLCMSLQNNGIIYFEGTYGTVEDEIALSLREDKMMVQMMKRRLTDFLGENACKQRKKEVI